MGFIHSTCSRFHPSSTIVLGDGGRLDYRPDCGIDALVVSDYHLCALKVSHRLTALTKGSIVKRFLFVMLVGCGSANDPPVLGDPMAAPVEMTEGGSDPCSSPAKGCPCDSDAGLEPVYCGLIYRVSPPNHVDCAKGFFYCREGVWSGCEGPTIYQGP